MKSHKHSFLSIFNAVLLVILVCLVGFLCFGFFQVNNALKSVTVDLQQNLNNVPLGDESSLTRFYGSLFSEIQEYGNLEESEQAAADLMTTVFEKTAQNSVVQSVNFEDDKIIVQVQTTGVAMSELDESFILKSATKAAWDYLSKDFFGAASSLFQGPEAIKRQLFSAYAPELLDSLSSELNAMPNGTVGYTITLRIEEGKWVMETLEETSNGELVNLNPQDSQDKDSSSSKASSQSSSSLESL